jgi:outer membrane protein assembly factor BamD
MEVDICMIKLFKTCAVVACVLMLTACASDKVVQDPAAKFKGLPEKSIYQGAERSLLEGDFPSAIKGFEALDALYPFGQYAQKAQLDSIYAYYETGDVPSTLATADHYIHLYPMGKHVDYAYYMRGIAEFYENHGPLETYFPVDYSQRDVTPLRQAFLDFSRLVYRFPHSVYTPDARLRMVYIRNILAQHELEIAHFYYERMAYVAAANRANDVVDHFQQSRAIPGALVLMAESYIKLKDKPSAIRSLTVLRTNFPNDRNLARLTKALSRI